jgi:glycogen synthase
MLGWEFPPYISGGLGTACQGLTRAMTRLDVEVLFVLPRATESGVTGAGLSAAGPMEFRAVPSTITSPYPAVGSFVQAGGTAVTDPHPVRVDLSRTTGPLCVIGAGASGGYEGDLINRVHQYAERCADMVKDERFDVIHAHDWVTFPAGIAIAAQSGKPLVVHVHSTEFDRSGECVNQPVYDIERQGMHAAQSVIAVSNRTRQTVLERYGVVPEKVRVVYNGIDGLPSMESMAGGHTNGRAVKTVLFAGRLTMQKGPGYFVQAAARVLARRDDVQFIMAGWGDLGPPMIEQVAAMGLGAKVRFTGFLPHRDLDRVYRMADVYVMPSVSEPFGLTALEAIRRGVPVILSKSSGVAEVLTHGVLKVDFWDTDRMADQILSVLARPRLGEIMKRMALAEIRGLTWDSAALQCMRLYEEQLEMCLN